jgi:hypothetical protein
LEITFKNGPFETDGPWAGSANRAVEEEIVSEAKSIFPDSRVAADFDRFVV